MRRIGAGAVLIGVLACPAGAAAHGGHAAGSDGTAGRSTLEQTITGSDPAAGFAFLRAGPGERRVVRQDLATARAGRQQRRVSQAYVGQVSDFQLADEESPARVEFVDFAASSAHRPQEALVPHQLDWTIRQLNRFVQSPVLQGNGSRARMVNAVMTGDLADNAQLNETEWVVRLLEGGTLDPNSGTSDRTGALCPPGVPLENPRNYTGVQDRDDTIAAGYFDPDAPAGAFAGWPRWTGLLDRAQQPFQVQGLRVPSYIAFGNHDGLVQGNEDALAPIEGLATGCIKPLALAPGGLNATFDPAYLLSVATNPSRAMLVPPDPRRRFVDKAQFKDLFDTGRQADRHGFAFVDPAELRASAGAASYYAWTPKPGMRFVVLDTVSEGGITPASSEGNIDRPQFRWLERELRSSSARDELVVVFGHHAKTSLNADVPDEAAAPCSANDPHGHDVNPGCDRDPRASTPLALGDELEALLHRYPRVVSYVAGHSHENQVQAYRSDTGGDYWEIKSPAVADWPPQHRLIEVMTNCDGTLSIFGTMLDHAARISSPGPGSAAGFSAEQLASIGRTITWNDPQHTDHEAAGTTRDRNVELLLRDPRVRGANAGLVQVTLTPGRVIAGQRTRFRLRVTAAGASGRRAVAGATIRLAGVTATTNADGRATIVARPTRAGRLTARATNRVGCADTASVTVRARSGGTGPGGSFTGRASD
jgi:metallophosphoesterase (TIGR03767 family)